MATAAARDEDLVRVVIRCRPMSSKEVDDGYKSIVEIKGLDKLIVHNPKSDEATLKQNLNQTYSHEYSFHRVFGPGSSQREVYEQVCSRLVDSVLEGYNGTIFVYGQTGTGKTYTMEGSCLIGEKKVKSAQPMGIKKARPVGSKSKSAVAQSSTNGSPSREVGEESLGIIPRTFKHIFDHVETQRGIQFLIRASYLEIYQEEIRDLLRKDESIKPELHERPDSGVYVKNLTSFVCKSRGEIERVMRIGNQNRMVGATDMNERSSRSHAIFMITIEQQRQSNSASRAGTEDRKLDKSKENKKVIKVGRLNLVDLAGSERQRKTNSSGQRQKESIKINLSLSTLGNVINSLMKLHSNNEQPSNKVMDEPTKQMQSNFIPYRDSKLTRLLQDSLGGNAKTLMIANIGPASYNYDETINTLNYASRTKYIRNKPRLNEDPKDALLRELEREISELKAKLSTYSANEVAIPNEASLRVEPDKVKDELDQLKLKLSSLESKLLNRYDCPELANEETTDQGQLLQGYTKEQERQLERSRLELVDQTGREQAIQDELGRHEEVEFQTKQSYGSIQQEIAAKKKLIKQVLLKTKSIREDLETNQQAYRLELDELDQLQYNLQKELKLKCLIMDNFIPNCHVDQVLPRITYDEKRNSCSIRPLELSLDRCQFEAADEEPKSRVRICSDFESIGAAIYPNSLRFKGENLIEARLDFVALEAPARLGHGKTGSSSSETGELTRDEKMALAGSGILPDRLQELIDDALSQREPDIVI